MTMQKTDEKPQTIVLSLGTVGAGFSILAIIVSAVLFVSERPTRDEVQRMISTSQVAQVELQRRTETELAQLRSLIERQILDVRTVDRSRQDRDRTDQ